MNTDSYISILKAAGLSALLIVTFQALNLMYTTAFHIGLLALLAYLVMNREYIPGWFRKIRTMKMKEFVVYAAIILAVILFRKYIPTLLIWGIIIGMLLFYEERNFSKIGADTIYWIPLSTTVFAVLHQSYFSLFMSLTMVLAWAVYRFMYRRIQISWG